jgi:LacI family transcriptional regulator
LPQVYATVQAGHLESWHISSVSVDNRLQWRQAVEKLLELGHQSIALLGYFAGIADSTGQRLHGAVDALEAVGLKHHPALFAECDFTLAAGYQGTQKLLASGLPFSGLFCSSDIIAIGAMRALADAGFCVPQDVSVIGFDGIEVGQYLTPSLTTFRQPSEIIARESVRLMRQLIESQKPEHLLVDCQFINGASIARAKGA